MHEPSADCSSEKRLSLTEKERVPLVISLLSQMEPARALLLPPARGRLRLYETKDNVMVQYNKIDYVDCVCIKRTLRMTKIRVSTEYKYQVTHIMCVIHNMKLVLMQTHYLVY
jgi:hypothetical protein